MARRHGPAHRVPRRGRRLLPRPRRLAHRAARSRPPASPSPPSPASPCAGSTTPPPTGRAPPSAPARCCRRSTPGTAGSTRTATRARGAGRDHPPLGVGPRQLDRLGRGLRAGADRGHRALRAPRHPARRPRPPADQGTVRPLHLAGAALPRSRVGQLEAARGVAVPDRRSRLQRHPDPRRAPTSPTSPTRSARRSSRRRTASAPKKASRRWSGSGASGTGNTYASTATTGELVDSASIGGLLAAFAAVPPARAAAVARTIERLAGRRRLHRALARPGRPALRQQALLARAGLARRQLHDRRRAGAGRRDGGRRADPRVRASS